MDGINHQKWMVHYCYTHINWSWWISNMRATSKWLHPKAAGFGGARYCDIHTETKTPGKSQEAQEDHIPKTAKFKHDHIPIIPWFVQVIHARKFQINEVSIDRSWEVPFQSRKDEAVFMGKSRENRVSMLDLPLQREGTCAAKFAGRASSPQSWLRNHP